MYGYVLDTRVFKHPVQVHAVLMYFENQYKVYAAPADTGVPRKIKDHTMPLLRLAAQKPSAKCASFTTASNLFQPR